MELLSDRNGVIDLNLPINGGTATAVVTISAAEYPALLKEVYKRVDSSKPRSLIGLAKDLPLGGCF